MSSTINEDTLTGGLEPTAIHVIPHEGAWQVRRGQDRCERPIATLESRSDAIVRAREAATSLDADVVIHGRDGQIVATLALR
jgi:hypothetical protein